MFGIVYSALAYLGFLGCFVYFALFCSGVTPVHVDGGALVALPGPAFVNLALVLLFGVQHSVMARASFKERLVRFIPEQLERSTFVLASTICLGLVIALWQPIGGTVWEVTQHEVRTVLWTLSAVGWVFVPVTSFLIDHFDLFGLSQTWFHYRRRTYLRRGFVTPWLYRYVRHPMMTALLVGLWAVPEMTVGHLILSGGMTVYVLIGVHFEERSLRRELGKDYARYQVETPKFVPRISGQSDPSLAPREAR